MNVSLSWQFKTDHWQWMLEKDSEVWRRILQGVPFGQLSFLFRTASDTLPTPLGRWRYWVHSTCPQCGSHSSITKHILNVCPVALCQGQYDWRILLNTFTKEGKPYEDMEIFIARESTMYSISRPCMCAILYLHVLLSIWLFRPDTNITFLTWFSQTCNVFLSFSIELLVTGSIATSPHTLLFFYVVFDLPSLIVSNDFILVHYSIPIMHEHYRRWIKLRSPSYWSF